MWACFCNCLGVCLLSRQKKEMGWCYWWQIRGCICLADRQKKEMEVTGDRSGDCVCSGDRRKRWEVTGDRSGGGCTNRTLTCATRGWWRVSRGGRIPCCWWRCWRQSGFWWGVHSQSCSNTDLHPLSSAMPVGRHTLHWHTYSGSTGQVKTCYLHWYGYWSSDDTHYAGTHTLAVLVRWRQLTCIYALVWLQE